MSFRNSLPSACPVHFCINIYFREDIRDANQAISMQKTCKYFQQGVRFTVAKVFDQKHEDFVFVLPRFRKRMGNHSVWERWNRVF